MKSSTDGQKNLITSSAACAPTSSQKKSDTLPLYKLTMGLRQLYKRVDDDYYKNHAGEYKIDTNVPVIGNYTIQAKVGSGSFGQVFYAFHNESKQQVAIKIINSKEDYTIQAQDEIRVINKLNEAGGHLSIVKLLDQFQFNHHQCLVFERLSISLYQVIKKTGHNGVSLGLTREFGHQILDALLFLKRNNIIHCDLKPENILLVHERRARLKIIDFGSSCTTTTRPLTYIQSRYYRAPEVILGCDYSCAIDMFSLGCILLEMHNGLPLFPGKDEKEQMYLFYNSKGLPPDSMLLRGKYTGKFFEYDMNTNTFTLKPLSQNLNHLKPLTVEAALGINDNPDASSPFRRRKETESIDRYKEFASFLDATLNYSPEWRITPEEGLVHVFFSHKITNSNSVVQPASSGNICPQPSTKRSRPSE